MDARAAGGGDARRRIQQVDTPKELYAQPANLFVASFIGSPAMNLVEARLDGAHARVRRSTDPARAGTSPSTRMDEIVLGIRPESFEDASFADPVAAALDVEVTVLEDLGSDALVVFHLDAHPCPHGGAAATIRTRRRCSPARAPGSPRASSVRRRKHVRVRRAACRRSGRIPLLRPRDGREPAPRCRRRTSCTNAGRLLARPPT
jgi:ABC-type sugar transport system ATPase subunit